MPTLSEAHIAELIQPYRQQALRQPTGLTLRPETEVHARLSKYLDLLVRWNARTNLTSVRKPEQIVTRHFGESLFAADVLASHLQDSTSILDLGTGAGFPGIPIQILLPNVRVTLAESQGKKAAFLREVIRTLGLTSQVWAQRVELLSPGVEFDVVTMRAVDRMSEMAKLGWDKVRHGGLLLQMTTGSGFAEAHSIPATKDSVVVIRRKT